MLDMLNNVDIRTEVRTMAYPIFKVYRLRDPRNLEIRYYGLTSCDLLKRLSEHISEKFRINRAKKAWIEELALEGLKPLIELVSEHTTKQEGLIEESKIIYAGLKAGQNLFNREKKLLKLI